MNVTLMLELYRRAAVPFVAESIRMFKAMSPADQAELLFYMIMDNASAGQTVQAQAAQGGKTQ